MPAVRIGTRGSALALAQARLVAAGLEGVGRPHRLVVVETEGDRRAPDTAWGEGAFVTAIEQALLDGRVDLAVHSAKDVPTDEDERLVIAAYLPRAEPGDALVLPVGSPVTGLDMLPAGSVVGTDSPRRAGFLAARRPDVEIRPLHGNVDTRLRRLDGGEVDALVLAVAGLTRLGRDDRVTERLGPDIVPPAPGQGAIAVQVRAEDAATRSAVTPLDDRPTRLAVETERAFLRAAGGGCRAPIGALAVVHGAHVRLLGGFAENGRAAIDLVDGPAEAFPARAEALAAALAAQIGRRRPTSPARDGDPVGARRRVLLTRPAAQAIPLVERLRAEGIEPVVVPAIAIQPAPAGGALDGALGRLATFRWAVVTSRNGTRSVLAAARRVGADLAATSWAAVGDATAVELERAGVRDVWRPRTARGSAVGSDLPIVQGDRVLLLRGSLAGGDLPDELRRRGGHVEAVEAYRTIEAPVASEALMADALGGPDLDAVLFTSASAVRGSLALAGPGRAARLLATPAICIGPETAREAHRAGFRVLGEAAVQSTPALAAMAARLLRPVHPGVAP